MHFYHFTSGKHLRGIGRFGLTVGDVPTDLDMLEGKIGVWFTTRDQPNGMGLDNSSADKKRYRLEVDLPSDAPGLVKWTSWAKNNVTIATYQALLRTAGDGGKAGDDWYVFFGQVKSEDIMQVIDMRTGDAVSDWRTMWSEGDSVPGVAYWRRDKWQEKLFQQFRRRMNPRQS